MSDRNRTASKRQAPVTTTSHKRKGREMATEPKLEATTTETPDAAQPTDPAPDAQLAHTAEDTSGKRKIEKDREERNGVKRPSAGGLCRQVWDFCDSQHSADAVPSVKDVKLEAEARGWNPNNASIEYYAWRKFMGIRGRQPAKGVEAQQVAPEATE
jgi:hypothetical protein